MTIHIGVDIGGKVTDLAAYAGTGRIRYTKSLTTHARPLDLRFEVDEFAHGFAALVPCSLLPPAVYNASMSKIRNDKSTQWGD